MNHDVRHKDCERAEIARLLAEFEARGGTVERIETTLPPIEDDEDE